MSERERRRSRSRSRSRGGGRSKEEERRRGEVRRREDDNSRNKDNLGRRRGEEEQRREKSTRKVDGKRRALGSNNVCICGSLGTQAYLYVQQQVCQHISPIMHWTWSALHHVYHVKTYFMCKHNFYMYDIYIPTSISLP